MDEKKFKVGDRVKIAVGPEALAELPGLRKWVGFTAVVDVESNTIGSTHLVPRSKRPDGFGMEGFYWDTAELELVGGDAAHSLSVGDRVVFDNGGENCYGRKPGDLGVVVRVYGGYMDDLVLVDWDKDGDWGNIVYADRLRLADEVKDGLDVPVLGWGVLTVKRAGRALVEIRQSAPPQHVADWMRLSDGALTQMTPGEAERLIKALQAALSTIREAA